MLRRGSISCFFSEKTTPQVPATAGCLVRPVLLLLRYCAQRRHISLRLHRPVDAMNASKVEIHGIPTGQQKTFRSDIRSRGAAQPSVPLRPFAG